MTPKKRNDDLALVLARQMAYIGNGKVCYIRIRPTQRGQTDVHRFHDIVQGDMPIDPLCTRDAECSLLTTLTCTIDGVDQGDLTRHIPVAQMRLFMARCLALYDYVLFDLPCPFQCHEAALLMEHTDVQLCTMAWDRIPVQRVKALSVRLSGLNMCNVRYVIHGVNLPVHRQYRYEDMIVHTGY